MVMMQQEEDMELQLWEYIDDTCSAADKARISALIATDVIWQQAYDELSIVNGQLYARLESEQPSLRFSKNVMEEIAQVKIAPATRKYINPSVIKGIAAFFIVAIAAFFVYALSNIPMHDTTPTIVTPLINSDRFKNISFGGSAINALIVINIVLGLFVMDYFLRRKQRLNY